VAFLEGLVHWHWWVAGILLAILEVFAPGAIFLWIGIAAGVVGVIVLFVPGLDWQYQFLVFGLLSVARIVVSRRYLRRHPIETDRPELNRRGQQYVGRSFTLAEPIKNGRGRLHVDDTMWKIVGPELAEGSQIRVVGVDGVMLEVEAAASQASSEEAEA
jgi:membrane protein implicated in regulation of membrane protease activity